MRNIKYILVIISLSILFSACKKDLVGLNENPNDSTTVDPALLFKQSLKDGAGSYNSDVDVEQWSIMNWCMYLATRGGVAVGDEYVVPSGKDALWTEQFSRALMGAQQTINLSSDPSMVNLNAAAKIWKVFLFHKITDLWGEIPYSEALKGYSDLTYAPKYDTQKEIYYAMLKDLKDAVSGIDQSKAMAFSESDLIYMGNMDHWTRFANSLRLRIATHLKYVDAEKYASEMNDLQNQLLIDGNTQSAIFPFNSEKKNHLYEVVYSQQAATRNNPSHFLTELLSSTNDPRISIFLDVTPRSVIYPWEKKYKGVPNLLENTNTTWSSFQNDWTDISPIGNWFLRDETPGVFIGYSEVCFLKAEAALEGLWSGSADEFLKDGIRANIDFYGYYGEIEHQLNATKVDDYLASIQTIDLETIITQKWISFTFENGYEAYVEYRRTGFPVLTDYDNNPINKSIFPNRLPYPSTENSLNNTHYSEAIARQGTDDEFTKLWWDTNH